MKKSSYMAMLACMLTGVLFIWSSTSFSAEPLDKLERNKTLVMETITILDAGLLDDLDKYMTADYVRHSQATPEAVVNSLEDFKALLQAWDLMFSDIKTKVDVLVAEGDLVAFYGSYSAIQIGPMGSFPATGKQMVSEFAGYHRIADGKITETWVTWDNLATLIQLGHFPPPDQKADASD